MASVQRRKITALGLNELFDALICTDELGQEFWKPSPIPFKVALALLGMCPSESVYVGNDPAKDFGGPNEIGMVTIRVDRCYQGEVLQNSGGTPSCAKWIVGGLKDILPFIRVKGA
jgi:putative hydrolase of the HAD superfamily